MSPLCWLQAMKVVEVPIYDFTKHQRSQQTRRVPPANVIIIEGILVLHSEPPPVLIKHASCWGAHVPFACHGERTEGGL